MRWSHGELMGLPVSVYRELVAWAGETAAAPGGGAAAGGLEGLDDLMF